MSLAKRKAQSKPDDVQQNSVILEALARNENESFDVEKEEQARALSISKLTEHTPGVLKLLTELNIGEIPHVLKMSALSNILEEELGTQGENNTLLATYPLEYIKYRIATKRKGRNEIVDIAKQKQDDMGRRFMMGNLFRGNNP